METVGAVRGEASAGSTLHERALQVERAKSHDDGTDNFSAKFRSYRRRSGAL